MISRLICQLFGHDEANIERHHTKDATLETCSRCLDDWEIWRNPLEEMFGEEPVTLSAYHHAGPAAEKADEYCKRHGLVYPSRVLEGGVE